MRDKRRGDVGPAMHEIDDARGKTRAMEEIREHLTDRRRLLARLEDRGVPEHERRHEMAVGKMRREVERTKHRHHAVRAESAEAFDARRRADRKAPHPIHHAIVERDVDLARDRRGFEPRLGKHLAHLAADQPRERLALLLDERLEPPQEFDAGLERRRGPRRLRGAGGRDRLVDGARLRRAGPDDFLGIRGVVRTQPAAGDRSPLAADEIGGLEAAGADLAHADAAFVCRRREPCGLTGVTPIDMPGSAPIVSASAAVIATRSPSIRHRPRIAR